MKNWQAWRAIRRLTFGYDYLYRATVWLVIRNVPHPLDDFAVSQHADGLALARVTGGAPDAALESFMVLTVRFNQLVNRRRVVNKEL